MKIMNLGSLCIDHVYAVPHFVKPGETLSCTNYEVHPGGKGLNQSLALANAGAPVWHAGKVGAEGGWLVDLLNKAGVDTRLIDSSDQPGGHANIQVTPAGENAIVIYGGANRTITSEHLDRVFAELGTDDILLLQNEISCMPEILARAADMALRVVFNTAPMTREVLAYPLQAVSLLVVNELEGQALSGSNEPDVMLDILGKKYPDTAILLTLSELGACYCQGGTQIRHPAFPVDAVDTTGAGDTFTGYFVAAWCQNKSIEDCLKFACMAAALCVCQPGAASSIPKRVDIRQTFNVSLE